METATELLAPPRHAPRRFSRASRVVFSLAALAAALLFAGCFAIALLPFIARRYMDAVLRDDPSAAVAATTRLARISIPEIFEPRGTVELAGRFDGDCLTEMVIYRTRGGDGVLALARPSGAAKPCSPERELIGVRRILSRMEEYEAAFLLTDAELLNVPTDGETAQFLILRGRNISRYAPGMPPGDEYWDVSGRFRGVYGTTILMLRAPKTSLSINELRQMLRSIR